MQEITTVEDVGACLAASETAPVFIYKHSTACPISAEAYRRVQAFLADRPEGCPEFRMVKVIESRAASNEIAAVLGVVHKSPQLILVRDRCVLWSASHHGIHAEAIRDALARFVSSA